ncbi:MAG: Uma2 family endonuclease [Ferruginibacter sp.]|nr:Uma2 family endonuclease [Ferruginibacter sp.]
MKPITEHRKFESIEAYLAFEEKSEIRHEYYFENLVEMAGTTKQHNRIVFFLTLLFKQGLSDQAFEISSEQVKAFIESENIFFYPDVMVANPEENEFFNSQPILIAEVLSGNTRKFDMVDKFIQYQKLDTLQYYLLVEPEKHLVIVHKKNKAADWQTDTYTSLTDIIDLPALQISIALKDIYKV